MKFKANTNIEREKKIKNQELLKLLLIIQSQETVLQIYQVSNQ